MNRYAQMIERQSKEIYGLMERLPVVFVFAEEQFAEGMRKLGLEPDQTDLVCRIAETGAMLRKSDAKELIELVVRHCGEQSLALDSDPTGEGIIAEMFEYELGRCEYSTNLDILKVFESAGVTYQDIESDDRLSHGLDIALERYMGKEIDHGTWELLRQRRSGDAVVH